MEGEADDAVVRCQSEWRADWAAVGHNRPLGTHYLSPQSGRPHSLIL
jgi:hypothetical protein